MLPYIYKLGSAEVKDLYGKASEAFCKQNQVSYMHHTKSACEKTEFTITCNSSTDNCILKSDNCFEWVMRCMHL